MIRAIDQKTFMEAAVAFAHLDSLRQAKKLDAEDLIVGYTALFEAVCDTIHRKDVEKMTMAQCSALYVEILAQVTGETARVREPKESTEKKNALIS